MSDRYRFDRFELRPVERLLLRDSSPVLLGPRAFDVLLMLVVHRNRLVAKAELLDRVWPGRVVEEGNIQVQISALRKVLGPHAIATIPGLGYRLAVAVNEGSEAAAAPPVSVPPAGLSHAPASPTNLPAVLDPLIGRDDDLAELRSLLAQHRLVTLVGCGGVGKTRLAQEAARARFDSHPRGVWWVDLAALSSAQAVVPSIAMAVNVPLGKADALAHLVRSLMRHSLLLVFDNCEHLAADVAAIVRTLLEGTEGIRVLATSREALKVPGEQLYPLMPLELPPPGTPLARARRYGALHLLERRATAADRRFQLTNANLADATELCRQLDGVPLAIEMAAARIPLFGVRGLRQELGNRLDLLQAPSRDAPSRQKNLRFTLEWSHSLLDGDEQTLLRRLSVFAGSFRLQAVQAAATQPLNEWTAVDALSGLVDKSLVKLTQLEPPRYRLLETTRLFAGEKLAAAGEVDHMHRRHGLAMAALAHDAQRTRRSNRAIRILAVYLPDYDDLQVAFDRACRRDDAEVAAVVLSLLRLIDFLRGLYSSSSHRVEEAARLLTHASRSGQARLHWFIATCSWVTLPGVSRLDSARSAVTLWRSIGDPHELYRSLAVAATESARVGDYLAAAEALREAREVENPSWPARVLVVRRVHEGWVALCRGDAAHYRDCLSQALALCEQEGEDEMANFSRIWLADASMMTGNVAACIALSRVVIETGRAFDQAEHLGRALCLHCEALLSIGDDEGARAVAAEALAIIEPDTVDWLYLLWCAGVLAERCGRHADAVRLLAECEEARDKDDPWTYPIHARLEENRIATIKASLGDEACLQPRSWGARLGSERARQLAQVVLAGPPAAPEPSR
ncbi:helix-turn-helix transcriptional regulator [Aquabacterium sp. A7-Y]|uniref:ATP-binding protein n=1 Tax=Aquabacterium sp. A7-Y TaxID=1349605 RepID=UPI00223CC991|nr:winged helix-turn-helix domain-containing protein [Aquabacterium sp. A7-Y]MCW7541361.1 helix-turn-helix transcriptional regulator [Aquabacterium sp. A7-Y]